MSDNLTDATGEIDIDTDDFADAVTNLRDAVICLNESEITLEMRDGSGEPTEVTIPATDLIDLSITIGTDSIDDADPEACAGGSAESLCRALRSHNFD